MMAMRERGIASTPWGPLLDVRRIRTERVLALLDRLARESALYLFADGPRPKLSAAESRLLRPLLALSTWSRGERRAAVRRLFDRLRLTEPSPQLRDSDVAVLVAKSTRPGWTDRLRAGRSARRSPVLGGAKLLAIFEDNAWSRPDLSLTILEAVRGNWRSRTLLSPEEPDWPAVLSTEVLRLLVATAVTRPKPGLWTRLTGGSLRRVLEGLDASLGSAIERLAGQSVVEQAIVVDAVVRHREQVTRAVTCAVARLPLAQADAYAGRFASVIAAPADAASVAPIAADGGATSFPTYVIRLAEGRI